MFCPMIGRERDRMSLPDRWHCPNGCGSIRRMHICFLEHHTPMERYLIKRIGLLEDELFNSSQKNGVSTHGQLAGGGGGKAMQKV